MQFDPTNKYDTAAVTRFILGIWKLRGVASVQKREDAPPPRVKRREYGAYIAEM